jgi:hypothetical protein
LVPQEIYDHIAEAGEQEQESLAGACLTAVAQHS